MSPSFTRTAFPQHPHKSCKLHLSRYWLLEKVMATPGIQELPRRQPLTLHGVAPFDNAVQKPTAAGLVPCSGEHWLSRASH